MKAFSRFKLNNFIYSAIHIPYVGFPVEPANKTHLYQFHDIPFIYLISLFNDDLNTDNLSF